jgi:YVTN family beta-propeller protein
VSAGSTQPREAAKPQAAPKTTGTLIVLNKAEATASLICRASGKTLAKLPTGAGPHEAAVSPDGRTALVSNYGPKADGSTLTMIDLPGRKVTRTISLGDYRAPHGLACLPDGKRALVTCEKNQALLVVDFEQDRVVQELPTNAKASHMVALAPAADRAYVANIASGSVTAFDLREGKELATIPTGVGSEGIDVSPDGKEIWVASNQGHSISIIDAAQLSVVKTLPCPGFPIRVKFTPSGKHVLVPAIESGELVIFDAAGRAELRRIPLKVGDGEEAPAAPPQFGDSTLPIGVTISPDGAQAFVSQMRMNRVAVIDLATWAVVDTHEAGKAPDGIAFSPIE